MFTKKGVSMYTARQLVMGLIVIGLIAAGVYWYRNRNVVEYKVVTKEVVKEEAPK